ncbi:MAG: DNA gyrase subunit A [Bacilli bacterium]|nr:DNA gyrase subunit A [Bacilli bacterium]
MEEKNIDKIEDINLSSEIKNSFLDYSMSVIVSRAIPDVRDGLKPVHRRILYTMYEEGMTPDRKHQKSANAVGAVMGHYHPHGDSAIYDSMARMAQDFTYRHVLVDGHGNFGSGDGDSPAASRYTEARLSKISMELLRDINKNTVDFIDNYDGQRKEPTILPSRFPNILINGNMGIAVGMATNIPPHNLGEVIDGCVAFIDNPDISVLELMQHIKGPDFPTYGFIIGNSGIKKAYETGRGSITLRGKAKIIEEENKKSQIVITEVPYQVSKTNDLTKKIGELIRNKQIDGISDLHDESTLEGIKLTIDLKKEANANVVLNNLYKHTPLQINYGINLLMLVDGRPKTLGLKEILRYYVEYQKSIIVRRTQFDLEKSRAREHILEGLKIALDNIDEIVKILKSSKDDNKAKEELKLRFGLTDIQSEAILEMKLRRLTGLERGKIEEELKQLLELIKELESILNDSKKVLDIIKKEMIEIKDKYSNERRTIIDTSSIENIEDEELITREEIIVTLTNNGYIKRLPLDTYRIQNRGGTGIKGMNTNEEDFVENLIMLNTHDYLLLFSDKGLIYRIKGYEVPEFSRQSKGLPIVNLLPLEKEEKITSILKITKEEENKCLLFATKRGLVKRCNVSEFENIRKTGKIAIKLKESDKLIAVLKTDGNTEVVMASSTGKMVRFDENEIRIMGRNATGVRGINLEKDAICIDANISDKNSEVLVVSENGYGKRTSIEEYRKTKRGSKGVKTLNATNKTGKIVAFKLVNDEEDLMIITDFGMIIRIPIVQISKMSRVTQGVRLINLKENQKVSSVFNIKE